MKKIILLTLTFGFNQLVAQEIPTLFPQVGPEFNFSEEFQAKFNSSQAFEECAEVWQTLRRVNRNEGELTSKEQEALKYCDEGKQDVWDIVGIGCSWYCGGGPEEVRPSSTLNSREEGTYSAGNAHDLSYQTAWVEGASGQGIGEYLVYNFSGESPRITKITVVNGYVKSPSVWQNNSRVKKLRVYYNDKPLAILMLEDVRAEQSFEVSPLGTSDRKDYAKMTLLPDWQLKFEILEVYPGDKYEDTVISEIYFDGLDVH